MWRAARALIPCDYTTLEGTSPPDEISNNLNNINDLKFPGRADGYPTGRRVAGRDCSRQAPSERHVQVSLHAAQALRTPCCGRGFTTSNRWLWTWAWQLEDVSHVLGPLRWLVQTHTD